MYAVNLDRKFGIDQSVDVRDIAGKVWFGLEGHKNFGDVGDFGEVGEVGDIWRSRNQMLEQFSFPHARP